MKQAQKKKRPRKPDLTQSTSKRRSLAVMFNLNDPKERQLYRFAQKLTNFNALVLRLLKKERRRMKRRFRNTPLPDHVLKEIKSEVERKEEEDMA